MILLVLLLASNFVFTWFIPVASVCACVASESHVLITFINCIFVQICIFVVLVDPVSSSRRCFLYLYIS